MKQSDHFGRMRIIALSLPNERQTSQRTKDTSAWERPGEPWQRNRIGLTGRYRPCAQGPMAMHEKRRPCEAAFPVGMRLTL
jgi:hypothetical protein